MRLIGNSEIDFYAGLITERFKEYPETNYMYKGIDNKRAEEINKLFYKLLITTYRKHDCVYVLPDKKGIIIAVKKPEVSEFKNYFIYIMFMRKFLSSITKEETKIITVNSNEMKNVSNFNWYKKLKIKNPAHIMYIAMNKNAQGTGSFRKLFLGYINKAKETNPESPIILETHTIENAELYEYFGFKTVKILEDKNIPFKQFCMKLD